MIKARWYFKKLRLLLLFVILIIFGFAEGKDSDSSNNELILKTSDDFETPVCERDSQCVVGGVCRPDVTGKKRCMCSTSCLMTVPVKCVQSNPVSCLTMGENYVSKYNTSLPYCHHNRCVCPPLFDPVPVKSPTPGVPFIPPFKCDKRELQIMLAISPADAVYKGTEATFYCCVNVDPRDFIPEEGVYFVQNGTRRREASTTPYQLFTTTDDSLFTVPTCWALSIANVQLSDSGSYSCMAQPLSANAKTLNETLNFTVKTPRMIQNFTINPRAHDATLTWDTQEGPMLKIGLKLYKRQGGKQEIWSSDNAKSPQQLTGLEPATPYSLFIQVQDGHAATFQLTEHFQTAEGKPGGPEKEEIRLIDTTSGLQCEVEWRPPLVTNGQVVKYFVRLAGKLRYQPQEFGESTVVPIDYPPALEPCKNYDGTSDDDGIDAKKNFFACKFGPLKPNRNYAATIWSQNSAGKSDPVFFTDQCFMDYAAPDEIDPPEMLVTHNVTSFSLKFNSPPKEYNGPIACYYLAVVPLPSNVSIQSLPKPDNIIMESYEEAMRNNIQVASSQAYYGYIAESYLTYPLHTIIGDNKFPARIEQCNVYYLSKSRFKAQDPPLQTDLKYTGFLIVRVDRDRELHTPQQLAFNKMFQHRRSKRASSSSSSKKFNFMDKKFQRQSRQLISIDPHYGYSSYFKPVFLHQTQSGTSGFHIFIIVFICLLALLATAGSILYFLYRKGFIKHFCPIKKEHNLLKQAFQPIVADELASEFIIRHRDSDYLFSAEFDALPKYKEMKFTASEKKENIKKNRYGDIKACDETRVKLKVTSDGSDYINANFIKGYAGKKTFIATQAPVSNTVEDFWQMIWEQDVRVVIMVANMKERGRQQVDKYWPDESEPNLHVHKDLEISCRDTVTFADYAKRDFDLIYSSYPTSSSTSPSTNHSNNSDRNSSILQRTGSFRQSQNHQHHPLPQHDPPPEEEESEYANISMLRPSSKNSNNRTNLLDTEVNREIRKIVHYHFTNWTDLRAPESTCGIMRLMMKLRKCDEYNNYPVLIHCSAGVGRTGTFIAIDSLIDQCTAEGKVDVFGTVSTIRQQRNGTMVQSQEQYVFIYRALVENLLFGDTDIPEESFCDHLIRLKHIPRERRTSGCSQVKMTSINVSYDCNGGASTSSGNNSSPPPTIVANVTQAAPTTTLTATNSVGAALNAKLKQWRNGLPNHNHKEITSSTKMSGIDAEYEKLFTCLDNIRTISTAQKEENIKKNRYPEIVPYDRYSILLAPRIGCSGSQYINATPHHGYFKDYFLAQDPVDSSTCHDLWRLIDDNQSRIIVMLSREDEFSPREKYWPEQQGVPFYFGNDEDLTVLLISEKVHPSYIERKLSYKFKRSEETIEVIQYAFTGWVSGAPAPPSSGPLRSLIRKIGDQQKQGIYHSSGPIVVHSRDGSFEPGLFVCISTLIERLEVEHMVDVFRTARAILQHRVGVFPKSEQYSFIYETIAEYIRSKP